MVMGICKLVLLSYLESHFIWVLQKFILAVVPGLDQSYYKSSFLFIVKMACRDSLQISVIWQNLVHARNASIHLLGKICGTHLHVERRED